MGERVLGFAMLELDPKKYHVRLSHSILILSDVEQDKYKYNTSEINFPTSDLVFVGLISLIDPPREAVPDAVQRCQVLIHFRLLANLVTLADGAH